jgi:hypothetical protein
MSVGKVLTTEADRDAIIKRLCLSVENGVYFVCTTQEYVAAQREDKEPRCIGFRREYILSEEAA